MLLSLQIFSQALSLPHLLLGPLSCKSWCIWHFSLRSLKLSSFPFIIFPYSAPQQWFPPVCLQLTRRQFSLLVPLPHLFCCWFLLCAFHFSYYILQLCLFFVFSNSLLRISCNFSLHPFFSKVLGSSLWSLLWTLSQVDCLSPLHLVVLRFYLVLLSGLYSFAVSFCLNFYLYFLCM